MLALLHAVSLTLSSLLPFAWLGPGQQLSQGSTACRCLYGDPCWPSTEAFTELASQLSQPLVHPHPLAHPCYASDLSTSPSCSIILSMWENGTWRSDHPGASQHPNFEAFVTADGQMNACYLNTSLNAPCQQGSVPEIAVDARTIKDIQLAVQFAARHNLRMVVKNTGHDFLGRSSGRGSLMLWTHHMNDRTTYASFRPLSAPPAEPPVSAMSVAAGVQWQEAYETADAAGMMIVGGISAGGSVGAAGGWLLGGGHSALSPTYGLGVDNVLEVTLVTSIGNNITANPYQHADLFWALRGGGGGTFGIVTSVTYRTYPIVPVVGAYLSASVNRPQPNAEMKQAFTELVRISSKLTDVGWGAYAHISPAMATNSFSLVFFALIPNVSWENANRTIQPFFDYVQALATTSPVTNGKEDVFTVEGAFTMELPSFWAMYQRIIPSTGQVGVNLELGSWLLPRDTLDNDYTHVAETLLPISGLSYELVAGGAVSRVAPAATGLNPAWRNAIAHVVFGTVWPDGASAETIKQLRGVLEEKTRTVRALAPESGAYFNEASMFEPDPRHAFFGAHYDRLKAIKKAYDPIHLFVVTEGVGADEWDHELTCRI